MLRDPITLMYRTCNYIHLLYQLLIVNHGALPCKSGESTAGARTQVFSCAGGSATAERE